MIMLVRWIVVLRLNILNLIERIAKSRDIIVAMTDNEYFQDPPPANPSLAELEKLTNETEEAYNNRDGTKESTRNYRNKEFNMVSAMNAMANYVENTANKEENREIGDAIVFSAVMDVKFNPGRDPQKASIRNLELSGSVFATLEVTRGNVAYDWEISMDGTNWERLRTTNVSSITIADLTPGSKPYLRGAAVVEGVRQNWQGPLNVIVT